ncbi:MAG: NAD-dependent epimerase/dehydratase family protein, partial [Acidimicrobiia bacterium]
VIGTMQLLAACQRSEHVKKVVIRSSSAVYGIDPSSPSVLPEDWSAKGAHLGYSSDVYDAETYARDFGRRRADVTLSILRMTNVLGPTVETNMTQFFSLPLIPTPLGFDPRLQFLHEDDAIEVLRRAVIEEHPGVFNVAPDGVVYLSQAARIARRLQLPIPSQLAGFIGGILSKAGVVDFPSDQLTLVVHGRVIDNARLKEVFGYEPKYSTVETLREFVATRGREVVGPPLLAEIEERIYDAVLGPSR